MSYRPRPPWSDRYKQNWDDAYRRMMAWWSGAGADRPLVLQAVPRPGAAPLDPRVDPGSLERQDLDERYQLALARHRLEGNVFPAEAAAAVRTGYGSTLCLLGAMAGAPTIYRADTNTAWIGEVPNLYDREVPQFDPACPPYAFTIRMIHRFHETFGYDALLGASPMLDPLTTLSMMRGPEQLCVDLVERPETVRRWTRRLGDLHLAIVTGFRAARAEHGRREDIGWTALWAPGDMDAVQCDFSTMLSPAMFREFVMPELERQLDFYDYAVWHLDGTDEIRHLDAILSLKKVRAIQWVDERGRRPLEYVDLFRRIRQSGRSVLPFGIRDVDMAVEFTRALGRDGLAFLTLGVKTVQEMEAALKRLAAV